ncbi:MAG: nucleotidyltransferase family protein, partial [Candidatus Margulisbacteria bacterium]|nr:nucleotidyltransferase family protein [Candidatus Margulisiibacteriota bacterium]
MDEPTVFHVISDLTKGKDISCILIGGFAVNYYKVSRQTADVDFLITEEDFKKIGKALASAGYQQDFSQEKVFVHFKSSDKPALLDIDFMLVSRETFAGMMKEGKSIQIAGQDFVVPSLNHLVALKLHSLKHNFKLRENKDLPDIISLIKANQLDCTSLEFKELSLKYGTEEIYKKILER